VLGDAVADQGLIEHRARAPGGDPRGAVAHVRLDVGGDEHGPPGVERLLYRAAGVGASAQGLALALGDRRAHEPVAVGGGLVEERDRGGGDGLGGLADVDPRMGAVKQVVDHVAELLEHPFALPRLADLPAYAGDELLGGKADDRRDRHGQHPGAILAVRVGRRPDDEVRQQVEKPHPGHHHAQVAA
jgi:hypothetical protein